MSEKKFFHEGEYAVTSERLVWQDRAYDLNKFDLHMVEWHGWTGSIVLGVLGLIALLFSGWLSTLVALAFFAGAAAYTYYRTDTLRIWQGGVEDSTVTLYLKRNKKLMQQIDRALTDRQKWMIEQDRASRTAYATRALDEISALPDD